MVANCACFFFDFYTKPCSLAHSELSSVFYEKVLLLAWGYVNAFYDTAPFLHCQKTNNE